MSQRQQLTLGTDAGYSDSEDKYKVNVKDKYKDKDKGKGNFCRLKVCSRCEPAAAVGANPGDRCGLLKQ